MFVVFLGATLWQCVPPAGAEVARSRGERDLVCPIERVSAYRAGHGLYVVRGCGKWLEYDCISSGRGTIYADTVCAARGVAMVHADSATSQ